MKNKTPQQLGDYGSDYFRLIINCGTSSDSIYQAHETRVTTTRLMRQGLQLPGSIEAGNETRETSTMAQ